MRSFFLLILFMLSLSGSACGKGTYYLFIGTYTDGEPGKGIYVYSFDTVKGKLKSISSGKNITNPSYLTIAPDGGHIYACTESLTSDAGSVSSFAFDSIHGTITFINKQASEGENPVYATVNKNGKWLINANYSQASVAAHPINVDGSLQPAAQFINYTDSSINKDRQAKAHIHAAVFSPQQDYIFFPDLGADKIRVYSFHPESEQPLQSTSAPFIKTEPGSGPRHFTFHPTEKYAYCIEELSGYISAYNYSSGGLQLIQHISSYKAQQEVYGSADIHISPDGLFLYASNRINENSISIFSIDTVTGQLTLVGHQSTRGEHPRNFTIDPTGNFLLVANQVSNNVVVFRRDKKTGKLSYTGTKIKIPNPSCLQIRRYGA